MEEEGGGQIDTPETLTSKMPDLLGLKINVHIFLVLMETSYTE